MENQFTETGYDRDHKRGRCQKIIKAFPKWNRYGHGRCENSVLREKGKKC